MPTEPSCGTLPLQPLTTHWLTRPPPKPCHPFRNLFRVRLVVEVRHHLDAGARPFCDIPMGEVVALKGTVYAVENTADWNTLLRMLQSTVRPFAVCVIAPR